VSTTKVAKVAVNPAKGNLQGQTTLAAKTDRWRGLNNNLAPQMDQLPQFKDQFAQFQDVLARAQALRDRLMVLKGEADEAVKQRDALFVEGDALFTRLGHALRAIHGPESGRLRDFGLKPRKLGRPKKQPTPTPEVSTAAVASSGGDPKAHGGAAAAPEK